MLDAVRQNWDVLNEASPGERFKALYRHRQKKQGQQRLRKLLVVGLSLVLVAAGLFMLVAPGPGLPVALLGAGLLAQESLITARVLDWSEVRARRLWDAAKRVWRRASLPGKALIVLVLIAIAAAGAYAAYRWMLEPMLKKFF